MEAKKTEVKKNEAKKVAVEPVKPVAAQPIPAPKVVEARTLPDALVLVKTARVVVEFIQGKDNRTEIVAALNGLKKADTFIAQAIEQDKAK